MHIHGVELIIVLLFMVLVLAIIAFRLNIPYPMVLLIGGTVIAFTPGIPRVVLDPELVFILFLPPILFSAAYLTSWRDFKAKRRPIGLLAVGGVLATMSIVAVVAHALIPEISWPVAFLLGAIVSPPTPWRRRRSSSGSASRTARSRFWKARASSTMPPP